MLHPFLHASTFGRGEGLETRINCPVYENETHGEVPYFESAATRNRDAGELSLFTVNRYAREELSLETRLSGTEIFRTALPPLFWNMIRVRILPGSGRL